MPFDFLAWAPLLTRCLCVTKKADELLYKAKQSRNAKEREELLEQSLQVMAAVAVPFFF